MKTRTKKLTLRKRLRRLRKRTFRLVKLAYVRPTAAETREHRQAAGLPTWRFDVTVVVLALSMGVPLLFR